MRLKDDMADERATHDVLETTRTQQTDEQMNRNNKPIFLSPPHMGGKEMRYVWEAFESGYIAPAGSQLADFEKEFSEKTGFPHAVAVSSGTAAIHLALRILGVGSGDEVAVSSLTFTGSVNPIVYLGASPIFIDSEKLS